MNILYCSEGFGPHDARFMNGIARLGHKPFHATLGKCVDRMDGKFDFVEADGTFAAFQEVVCQVASSWSIDCVHAGPIQTVAFPVIDALKGELPTIAMSWGSDILYPDRYGELSDSVATFVLQRCDGFIADCQAVVDRSIELGREDGPLAVFPWGTDTSYFCPPRTGARQRGGPLVLLSTRNWAPIYDVSTALEGVQLLLERNIDVSLRIAGSGPSENEILELARRLPDSRIEILGYLTHDELPSTYRSAGVYVSTSLSDGSSISLLEAMACGLPVVVTDIPGNREWVREGENGYLFELGDPHSFADAIERLSRMESEQLEKMGARNRELILRKGDWSKNLQRLGQLYQKVTS